MNIFKSIIWITITTLSYTNAFIAYDCSGPKLNITSFNSLQVDYCEQPPLPSSRQVPRIKLLQRAEIRTIFYRSCLISVDYLITRCSAFDDSQVVEGGFFFEILILGAARCAELHQKQVYLFPTGGMVAGLKINQTITATHTLIGILDREGNCQGASYSSDRGTWKNVVVQSNYKIYLGEGIANSQTKDNILIMPTGTRLKLSELYGLDTFKGEVIWSNDQISQSCDKTDFDVLYDGPASIIIADKQNPSRQETHTYMVESENIVFALKKIKKTFACEIPVIQTEHPQLYILIDSSFMNQFQTKQILPYNTDLMAYVNTKFVYIENFLKTTMTSLYADLLTKQCELERKMIIQKLSLASHSLSEFAYAMGEGPGYTAMNAGEIIYLLKCKAVNVEINTLKTCFNELPIIYQNKTYYMAPKTHTLQNYGTEIDCNTILPPAFLLEGEWFGIAPTLREIKKPIILKPSTTWTWTYKSPENLMVAGIYSHEIMNALQKHLLFPQEIDAAQKNIARQSLGHTYTDQGLRLQGLIDENTIGQMVENKLQKMWGWFTTLGTFVSGLLGIFFITKIIISLLNTGLNISLLYQTFGWSLKMLAGIFTNLTQFIMHKQHENKFKENMNDNKTHKEDIKQQLEQHQYVLTKPKKNPPKDTISI